MYLQGWMRSFDPSSQSSVKAIMHAVTSCSQPDHPSSVMATQYALLFSKLLEARVREICKETNGFCTALRCASTTALVCTVILHRLKQTKL